MNDYVFRLNSEEILYLAAAVGADSFYGVPDTLSRLSEAELKLKVLEIENSLEEKKYLESDFDGNKSFNEQLVRIMNCSGKCERFICIEKECVAETQQGWFYFLKGDDGAKMERAEDMYYFKEMSPADIREEVILEAKLPKTGRKSENHFEIKQDELEKAHALARRGSKEKGKQILIAAGASENIADIIIGGILKGASFYSMLFMDLEDEGEPSSSAIWLEGDELVLLEYAMENDEDYVFFFTAGSDEIKQKIEIGLEKVGCVDGDETEDQIENPEEIFS